MAASSAAGTSLRYYAVALIMKRIFYSALYVHAEARYLNLTATTAERQSCRRLDMLACLTRISGGFLAGYLSV